MQHLDEGTIHALLDGALEAAEVSRAEAHVAACADCAALVAEARGLIAGSSRIVATLDAMPVGAVGSADAGRPGRATDARFGRSDSLWKRLRATPARAAAAAVLIVAAGTVLTMRRTSEPRVTMGSTSTAPAVTPMSKARAAPMPRPAASADQGFIVDSAAVARGSSTPERRVRSAAQNTNAAPPASILDAAPSRALAAKTVRAPEAALTTAGAAGQMAAAPMAAKRLAGRAERADSRMREGVAATSAGHAVASPCYEFADSTPANIPTRFTLDTTRLNLTSRARAVSVPGAGNAAVRRPGAYWIQTTPTFVDVYWSADQRLRLQIPASSDDPAGARLWQGERTSSVQLRRCPG